MKRSIARWTTAVAATALLTVPAAGGAQTEGRSPATGAASAPTTGDRQTSGTESGGETATPASPQEHLRRAGAALNDIPAASLTGSTQAQVAEMRRHISTLEASAAGGASQSHTEQVAEIDRILTELLGAQSTTGAAPRPAGVAGAVGTSGGATLDDTARMKLQEVRRHVTAYVGAKSSTDASATPSADAAASSPTSASAPPSAGSATADTSPRDPTPSPTGTSPTATPQTAAPAQPATAGTSETATGHTGAADARQQPGGDPNAEAVKRHLTAARDALSQIAQLPSAAQLTGDTRVQVSQLISNFNELITTSSQWRASYAKVDANVEALLGPAGMASAASAPSSGAAVGTSGTADPTGTSGTADATGTAGTTGAPGASSGNGIPADIRGKLVEFRTHLKEFEKAAGSSATAPAATGADVATRSSETDPATASGSTSTGSPAQSGSMPGSTASAAAGTSAQATSGAGAGTAAGGNGAGQAEATRHIEAIEAILSRGSAGSRSATGTGGAAGTSGTAGTSGAATGTAGAGNGGGLDAAQIEQIRTHLNELRRVLGN